MPASRWIVLPPPMTELLCRRRSILKETAKAGSLRDAFCHDAEGAGSAPMRETARVSLLRCSDGGLGSKRATPVKSPARLKVRSTPIPDSSASLGAWSVVCHNPTHALQQKSPEAF